MRLGLNSPFIEEYVMSKNDDKIKQLMKVVEEKRDALSTKPKAAWCTNGIFKYDDGGGHFNLNTVTDPSALVDALAHIISNKNSLQAAADMLGVPLHEIQYDGYSVEEWAADFKLRIDMLKWDEEKKKLTKLQRQLDSLISEDAKTEMALEEIAKALA